MSVTVVNNGPDPITFARITDQVPAGFTAAGPWTCVAAGGAGCPITLGATLNNTAIPSLPVGGSATFSRTVTARATGTVTNAVTVTDPTTAAAGPDHAVDPNTADNVASDVVPVGYSVAAPALGLLDSFDRANANNLGGSWAQANSNVRIIGNQAAGVVGGGGGGGGGTGQAVWTGAPNAAGPQGASFTIANMPASNNAFAGLMLQASGGNANTPLRYIRIRYQGGNVTVNTIAGGGGGGGGGGGNGTPQASFAATFAAGDTLTAVVTSTNTVAIYKTSASVTVTVGAVTLNGWSAGNAPVRLGIQLSNNVRIDNFNGGSF
jgi:hypothetical protein